jgi:tRNA-splicing endonuclease subunit Sen2
MWGKGTLSRSQPSWRDRKTKEMTGQKQMSLEELTAFKRKERAKFKEGRLKRERLERERQLQLESKTGKGLDDIQEEEIPGHENDDHVDNEQSNHKRRKTMPSIEQELPEYSEEYLDKEVLQLAAEEALFLMHLNLLHVTYEGETLSFGQFLHYASTCSRPDDPFLVRYVVYYHFRQQRLIVKPGLKFGVDYLLYDRPIVFAHANHCVNVLGDYHLWNNMATKGRLIKEQMTWQEINLWQRLMGNVRKKLKLVYVEIPVPNGDEDWRDINGREDMGKLLQKYRIREVMNSRMVISKEREDKPDR